jgi:hypothetical protein
MPTPRIFLLSPAHCGGKRAAMLLRHGAEFELAERLRSPGGAPLGEVFAFLSGLYFRGKLAYAARFAAPPAGHASSLVITSNRGLLEPGTPVGPEELASFAAVPIDPRDPRYREPLAAEVELLARTAPPECRFILLGSIATAKYVELLLSFLGDRLCFPAPFVGMGDMQRGALLLRAAEAGEELPYLEAAGAVRSRGAARAPRPGAPSQPERWR